MLQPRWSAKLNTKTLLILVVPCILVIALLYLLGTANGKVSAPQNQTYVSMNSAESAENLTGDVSPSLGKQDSGLGIGTVLDVVAKFVIVMVLVLAALKGLQYYTKRTRSGGNRKSAIAVIESRNLAQNQSLHLVQIGEKALLIGATATQLSTLTEITDPATIARLRAESEPSADNKASFAKYLDSFKGTWQGSWHKQPGAASSHDAHMDKVQTATDIVRKASEQLKRSTK